MTASHAKFPAVQALSSLLYLSQDAVALSALQHPIKQPTEACMAWHVASAALSGSAWWLRSLGLGVWEDDMTLMYNACMATVACMHGFGALKVQSMTPPALPVSSFSSSSSAPGRSTASAKQQLTAAAGAAGAGAGSTAERAAPPPAATGAAAAATIPQQVLTTAAAASALPSMVGALSIALDTLASHPMRSAGVPPCHEYVMINVQHC